MLKNVIERDVPEAGNLSVEDLTAISRKSCEVLSGLGPQIEWVQSYLTRDRLYCVYVALSEDLIWEHARQGANRLWLFSASGSADVCNQPVAGPEIFSAG